MSRAERERRRRQLRRRRRSAVAGVLVVALAGVWFANTRTDDIPPDVTIGGIDVGGLRTDEAVERLRPAVRDQLRDRTIRFTTPDREGALLSMDAAILSSGADVAAAVEEARSSRGRIGRMMARVGIGGGRDIPLRYRLRPEGIATLVSQAQAALGTDPHPAAVRVQGQQVVVIPSRPGRRVDRATLLRRLADMPEEVPLPVVDTPPAPNDAEAERARALGERIRATPRTVTLNGRTATINSRVLTRALRFPVDGNRIRVTLNQNMLRSALVKPLGIGERAPRNARFRVDGQRARIIASQRGLRLDTAALATAIIGRPDVAAVTATLNRPMPEFTTAAARKLRIQEKIAEFTTPYDCCPPRVTNIQIAARQINAMVIQPGARFSLNDALGQRTADKGYLEAPMIAAGELVDSYGGGVSQVATTLYNAAFFGGLEIVSHTPHGFWISRYPRGREATISWGSPDLVIRNDWEAGVLIAAHAGDNAVTVALYSSKLGRRVETTMGEPTGEKQPETIERRNDSLDPGARVVKQSMGPAGFTISYTRKVFAGSSIKRDETFSWTYRPENAIVEVGPPLPDPPPADTTPEPDAEPTAPPADPAPAGDQPSTTGATP